MQTTTHQERKERRRRNDANAAAARRLHRPIPRRNHRRTIAIIQRAHAEGVEGAELLLMGRRLGLRDRHVRKAIVGKEVYSKLTHAVPRRHNWRRPRRLGRSMTVIMTLVQKAIDAGWEPGDPTPLSAEEMSQLRMARKRVVIPTNNINSIKLWRDPAWAERLKDRARMRRMVRDVKRRMLCPEDQLYNPDNPLQGVTKIVATDSGAAELDFSEAESRAWQVALDAGTCPVCGRRGLKVRNDRFPRHKTLASRDRDRVWCEGSNKPTGHWTRS